MIVNITKVRSHTDHTVQYTLYVEGELRCTCYAQRFHPDQDCKHVREYQNRRAVRDQKVETIRKRIEELQGTLKHLMEEA